MKKLFFVSSFLSLFACSTNQPKLETVPHVELKRFMGDWYVIANIPTFPEKNAYNAKESYSWNEKEKRIDVDYTMNKGGFEGEKKSIPQKAWVFNDKTNAEWRVQPFWPLKLAYLIIELAPDYSYTVIGVPDRDYVWIMARTKTMEPSVYGGIVQRLKAKEFDVSKIQRVPQTP